MGGICVQQHCLRCEFCLTRGLQRQARAMFGNAARLCIGLSLALASHWREVRPIDYPASKVLLVIYSYSTRYAMACCKICSSSYYG